MTALSNSTNGRGFPPLALSSPKGSSAPVLALPLLPPRRLSLVLPVKFPGAIAGRFQSVERLPDAVPRVQSNR
jgi:hypothetical protein